MSLSPKSTKPLIAITLGDVLGIGPELLIKAWENPVLHAEARLLVIGPAELVKREAVRWAPSRIRVCIYQETGNRDMQSSPQELPVISIGNAKILAETPARVSGLAGQIAYDCLLTAIDLAVRRQIDALVTLPLHKGGLAAAGLPFPGHTEILADSLGVADVAMVLYRRGLAVAHTTLHTSLASVPDLLTSRRIVDTGVVLDGLLRRLDPTTPPRLAVAALNPHASDGGLFGHEEESIIAPAVAELAARGLSVTGPVPADMLFVRAASGEYTGVVAMYHDQGHIALKLLGWRETVNITAGLPIIRTSVAHGTAYDIVGKGVADPTSLYEAVHVASQLALTGTGT